MTVKIDLRPLDQLKLEVSHGLRVPRKRGEISKALNQWAKLVRGFLQERFVRESKGGGDWPQLSRATLAARRNKARRRGPGGGRRKSIRNVRFKAGTSVSLGMAPRILRDTGTLFRALNPTFTNRPGAIEKDIPFGVRIGFGGPDKHSGGKATIVGIAMAHQTGAGRLPVRKIIVAPPAHVIEQMRSVMQRALDRLK
jgi:hypothetical protein